MTFWAWKNYRIFSAKDFLFYQAKECLYEGLRTRDKQFVAASDFFFNILFEYSLRVENAYFGSVQFFSSQSLRKGGSSSLSVAMLSSTRRSSKPCMGFLCRHHRGNPRHSSLVKLVQLGLVWFSVESMYGTPSFISNDTTRGPLMICIVKPSVVW